MPHISMLVLAPVAALVLPLSSAGASGGRAQDAATSGTSPPTDAPSSGWTNWKGDAGRTGVADAGPTGEPVELWRVQAGGSCNPPPAVVAGVVYAACDDGVLYALDAATGTERWRFAGTGFGNVTVAGTLVYVDDADALRALDAATGQQRWQAAVPCGTSPVVDDGLLVLGTCDGLLLGHDAATGAERWRFQVSAHGAAYGPALAGGIAYVGGDDVGFFAVDATTGTMLWQGDTGGDDVATAVVAEGIAYIGGHPDSSAGHLYAFDATSGELRWKRDQPLFTPTVLDGVGYSGGATGTVDAFDTTDGSPRWQAELGGKIRNVALAGGVLYALSDGPNAVYALDASTGAQLWSFPLDSSIDGGVAVTGGVAVVGTVFGGIYAIGGTDQGAVPAASADVAPPTVIETVVATVDATEPTEGAAAETANGAAVEEVWQSTGPDDGMDFPGPMALDPQGRLWVADTGNDRFAIFTPDGEFVETWGSRGDGDGEFVLERSNGDGYGAVAFAPDGSFYVLDVGNHRVQKFAPDRTFVTSWGGFGQAPGTYTDPIGIAVDTAGVVYVLDDARDVVERYTPDGEVLGSFDAHPATDGGSNTANSLSLDAAGNAYVSDITPYQVEKFDPDGNLVATIGAPGSADGQFKGQPLAIAVDANGRVFVSETPEGGRVQVFDADGRFLTSWGAEGEFPFGLVLDGDGNVYVADHVANTVQKLRLLPPLAPSPTGADPTTATTGG